MGERDVSKEQWKTTKELRKKIIQCYFVHNFNKGINKILFIYAVQQDTQSVSMSKFIHYVC